MLKKIVTLVLSLILIFITFNPLNEIKAEEENSDSEINAFIEESGEISSIKVNNWTSINITILDVFSMNWSSFKKNFFNWDEKPLWYLFNLVYWEILFGKNLDRPLNSFLGYTSLNFEIEFISNNNNGWNGKITPNTILNTTTGEKHFINLEVKIDEDLVDYSVIARIKCTRLDTFGVEYGYSYIDIPLKAEYSNYIKMNLKNETGYAGLNNLTKFEIDLTNKGFYKDMFFIELNYPDDISCNVDNQVIDLKSGETKTITINILTPEKIFDFGTPYVINITSYSLGNKTNKLIGSYTLITKGIFISPVTILILSLLILIASIIIIIYYWFIRKNRLQDE